MGWECGVKRKGKGEGTFSTPSRSREGRLPDLPECKFGYFKAKNLAVRAIWGWGRFDRFSDHYLAGFTFFWRDPILDGLRGVR